MEQVIKLNCSGQQKLITKQTLSTLQPIFTQSNLRSIFLPYWMNSFTPELDVFHSCFYYVLAVEKDIQQSRSINFRQKCLADISQYYLRHRMTFQLYEYAYLCAKILSIPIDRAMHILYFLVYARMASKPFISNQIKTMQRNVRQGNRQNTKKSRYTHSVRSKENKSRHFTMFGESSQCEVQTFKKELRDILKPEQSISKKIVRKGDSKKFLHFKKSKFNQSNHQNSEVQKNMNISSCRSINKNESMIPIKVCNNQNSSIIKRLGMRQKTINNNSSPKILFRRINFNQCSQYQSKGKEQKNFQCFRHNVSKDRKTAKEMKNHLSYFQNIRSEIKNKNELFDTVRYQCKLSNNIYGQLYSHISQKPSYFNFRKTQTFPRNSQLNDNITLRKSQTTIPNYGTIPYNPRYAENGSSITRNNENICLYDNLPGKKIAKKNRTHRYKVQFKHFLQTSIFKSARDTA